MLSVRRRGPRLRVLSVVVLLAVAVLEPAASAEEPSSTTQPSPTTQSTTTTVSAPSAPTTTPSTTSPSTTETTLPTDVDPPGVALRFTNDPFSPNGDGRRDVALIHLAIDEPATVTLLVRTSSGDEGHTFIDQEDLPVGTVTFVWRGSVQAGDGSWRRLRNGQPTVRAVATDAAGNTAQVARGIGVDTKPPVIRWRAVRPEPWDQRTRLGYRVELADRHPLRVRAEVRSDRSRITTTSAAPWVPGPRTFAWTPRYGNGRRLANGLYYARVVANDRAGNTGRSGDLRFRVWRPVTTRVIHRVPGAGRRVALTIDDCVSGSVWRSMMATLTRSRARATFFCNGNRVVANGRTARWTVSAGMSVGSHTYDHRRLPGLSFTAQKTRMTRDQQVWWSAARATPLPYFRPPYGAYNGVTLAAAGSAGYRFLILWDVDPRDWATSSPSTIRSRVLARARPGSVVLLHAKPATAAALGSIIRGRAA